MRSRSLCWLLVTGVAGACVSLTPAGAKVAVYRIAQDGSRVEHAMPEGCRLIAESAPVSITELEIEGQKDPYRIQRNEAGAAGANLLLVKSRVLVGRRNMDCPGSSPITDCPPDSGAWFRLIFASYTCAPDALRLVTVPVGTMP